MHFRIDCGTSSKSLYGTQLLISCDLQRSTLETLKKSSGRFFPFCQHFNETMSEKSEQPGKPFSGGFCGLVCSVEHCSSNVVAVTLTYRKD